MILFHLPFIRLTLVSRFSLFQVLKCLYNIAIKSILNKDYYLKGAEEYKIMMQLFKDIG